MTRPPGRLVRRVDHDTSPAAARIRAAVRVAGWIASGAMDLGALLLLGAVGVAAGSVNAVAGGGSLIMLPVLLAFGVPPVQATVTNSVSVTGGYSASVLGTRPDLRGQGARLRLLAPTVLLGALTG